MRGDFAAVGLLIAAVIANLLVQNYVPLFNGDAGLSLVPSPFQGSFNPQSADYSWGYAIASLVAAALVYPVRPSHHRIALWAVAPGDARQRRRRAASIGKNLIGTARQ